MKINIAFISTILYIISYCFSSTVVAQDGTLDLSFDFDGIQTTFIGSSNDAGNSVLIQPDNKIVVAGTSNLNFGVARYNADGTLDHTFGIGGKVSTPIGPGNAICNSVAIQSDGKLVLAGYNGIFPNYDIVVVRYNINGSLDTAFDKDGIVITAIGNAPIGSHSVIIQKDDKIVLTGYYNNSANADILVVRYNTNGSLDTSFNHSGIVITAVGNANDIGRSLTLQKDGKILVTGFSYIQRSFAYEFVVLRYNSDGSLDRSFDGDGMVTTDIVKENDYGETIMVQEDGHILVGGYSFTGNISLVRYNSNGSYDQSFGNNGKESIPFGCMYQNGYSMAIQKDGKILITGYSTLNNAEPDFTIARFTNFGELDATFGLKGLVQTAIGNGSDISTCIAIQSDGKIVIAGKSFNGNNFDFAVARYNNSISTNINLDFQHHNDIKISPIPFSSEINLTANNNFKDATITIYNSSGHQIYLVKNIYGQSYTLIHSILPSGIYFIRVDQQNELRVCKKWIILN